MDARECTLPLLDDFGRSVELVLSVTRRDLSIFGYILAERNRLFRKACSEDRSPVGSIILLTIKLPPRKDSEKLKELGWLDSANNPTVFGITEFEKTTLGEKIMERMRSSPSTWIPMLRLVNLGVLNKLPKRHRLNHLRGGNSEDDVLHDIFLITDGSGSQNFFVFKKRVYLREDINDNGDPVVCVLGLTEQECQQVLLELR